VDLGHIDLLVREGLYSNRTDVVGTPAKGRPLGVGRERTYSSADRQLGSTSLAMLAKPSTLMRSTSPRSRAASRSARL
jgi:Ribbon-Helix-Helix transcriptional regulator family